MEYGTRKDVAYSLKPPLSQATRSYSGKARLYEPKTLNETMLPSRRKKNLTISHTQHRTPSVSTPILTKEKEWELEKKEIHAGSKKKKKNRRKVK